MLSPHILCCSTAVQVHVPRSGFVQLSAGAKVQDFELLVTDLCNSLLDCLSCFCFRVLPCRLVPWSQPACAGYFRSDLMVRCSSMNQSGAALSHPGAACLLGNSISTFCNVNQLVLKWIKEISNSDKIIDKLPCYRLI